MTIVRKNVHVVHSVMSVLGVVLVALHLLYPSEIWFWFAVIALIVGSVLLWITTNETSSKSSVSQSPLASSSLTTTSSPDLSAIKKQITTYTNTQQARLDEQAAIIGSTNVLLNQHIDQTDYMEDVAHRITQLATHTTQITADGKSTVQASIQVMEHVRRQVAAIAETITELAQLTRRIDTIITSVSEIATQSNLLALNASIEAARAGTHGQGFAVVADEVRLLAGQSTQASAEIRTLLREVQAAITQTIDATQSGMQEVNQGVAKSRQTEQMIQQITQAITDSNESGVNIYNAIRRQGDILETITINLERIKHITQGESSDARLLQSVSENIDASAEAETPVINQSQ